MTPSLRAQEVSGLPALAPLNPHYLEDLHEYNQDVVPSLRFSQAGYPLGLRPSTMDFKHLVGQPSLVEQSATGLPPSYDLRNYGKVSPVKNQLQCGDCWAFATFASMESVLLPAESWNFSENNLNNRSGFDFGVCSGGNGQMSTAYLARWSGPIAASDDPDPTSASCTSQSSCSNPSPQTLSPRKHVQNVIFLAARTSSTDNANLKTAIMNHGGVHVSISADELGWTNPYWNENNDAYYYNGAQVCKDNSGNAAQCRIDHAVTLVGWDDNYPASNFATRPTGNGAFIVKNSWGTSFGSSGFFWISYYDTSLAYQESFVYVDSQSTTNYTTAYQYDPLGLVNSFGYSGPTAWEANIFTAKATGKLQAIATYALSNNSTYTVEIYTNATNGPISGTQATTFSGTISLSGYNTIVLPTAVPITKGQMFSVVVKLTTPGYNWPIPVQYAMPGYSSQATASAGQSFVSADGNSWTDTTTVNSTMSAALKAFSTDAPPVAALSSFTISPASVLSGSSAILKIALTAPAPTGGALIQLTSSNTSLFPVTNYTIPAGQSSGSPATRAGTATTLQTVTVKATYAGVTKQATVSIIPPKTPPVPATGSSSSVTSNSATLSGTVNPEGSDTHFWFLYGNSSTLIGAGQTASQDVGSGTSAAAISANIAGLKPAAVYYFQLVAQNSGGTTKGNINHFTTQPQAKSPTVTTGSASAITAKTATVSGTVNPNGSDTSVWFLISSSSAMSGAVKSTPYDAGSGTTSVTVQCAITGMSPGTTYYYQVVAQNSAGTVSGTVNHFTTTQASTPPTVTTGSASAITNNTATTYGTINPNGSDTHVWFLIATNSAMSGAAQTPAYDAGSGTTSLQIQCAWTGLVAGTTYYYQFVAQNSAGTAKGAVNQFTTTKPASPPTVTTGSAGTITTNSAIVFGNVNPNGSDAHVWFLIATNSAMSGAVQSPPYDAGSGSTSLQIQCTWTGLSPNTTYYYQFVAQNNSGTVKGAVMNFKTMPGAGLPLVSTTSATNIAATTATINGTVNPNGADTLAWFQIAANSSMTGGVQSNAVDVGSANATYQIQCAITGMSPGGTYYYRIVAKNSYGTVQGSVMHFTTSSQTGRSTTAGQPEQGLRAISPTVLGSMGLTGGNIHLSMAAESAKPITGVVQAPFQQPQGSNPVPTGLSAGATSLSGPGAKPKQRANPRR